MLSTLEKDLLESVKKLKKIDKDKELEKIPLSSVIAFHKNLEQSLHKSLDIVTKQNLFNSLTFFMSNELWNDYGIYGSKKKQTRNKSASNTYSRGRLLFIDFGQHNIGLEFSYEHIGIVLQDFGKLVTVVPVTSDRGQTFDPNIEKAVIRVKSSSYNQFENDSILLLHQIRSVGKNRIVKDLFKTIGKTPLMESVEKNILSTYTPFVNKSFNENIAELNKQIGEKELKIEKLTEKLKAAGIPTE